MSHNLNKYIQRGLLYFCFSLCLYSSIYADNSTGLKDKIPDIKKIAQVKTLNITNQFLQVSPLNTENKKTFLGYESGLDIGTTSKWSMIGFIGLFMVMSFVSMYLVKDYGKKKRIQQILIAKNQVIQKQKNEIEVKNKTLATSNLILEQKVRERTFDLQQSKEQLEQYVYLASHDLRQPLRSIAGFSQLLTKELRKVEPVNPGINEYLDYIVGGVKYMDQLIEDIISYSRMSTDDKKHFVSINLRNLFDKLIIRMKTVIQTNKVEIDIHVADIEIEAVEEKITQVFEQLILNSIHFRKLTEPPRISIKAKKVDEQVHISIGDNGLGIEEEYIEKVFEPFVQLQSKHIYGGSGMGLTLCKRIIDHHEGQIWIESEPGVFTTVFVVLPVSNKL